MLLIAALAFLLFGHPFAAMVCVLIYLALD